MRRRRERKEGDAQPLSRAMMQNVAVCSYATMSRFCSSLPLHPSSPAAIAPGIEATTSILVPCDVPSQFSSTQETAVMIAPSQARTGSA